LAPALEQGLDLVAVRDSPGPLPCCDERAAGVGESEGIELVGAIEPGGDEPGGERITSVLRLHWVDIEAVVAEDFIVPANLRPRPFPFPHDHTVLEGGRINRGDRLRLASVEKQ
jgi:hypothetical protein